MEIEVRGEMKEGRGDTPATAKDVAPFEKQRRRNGRAIHNSTKLIRVIKLNSLQFKLSFVNFRGMILKRRKNHRNRATENKASPFSVLLSLSLSLSLSHLFATSHRSPLPIIGRCPFTFVSVNRFKRCKRFFFHHKLLLDKS